MSMYGLILIALAAAVVFTAIYMERNIGKEDHEEIDE